jgi:cysteine-rich repeat protein
VQTACTYTAQQTTAGVWNSDIFPGSCSGAGTATCSNLVVETGEQCDDGNLISGDGCSASCQLENNLYINSIPVSQDVAKGNSAVYAIDANYTGASIANAKFTVSNCPVGSTCTFANGSNNQTTPFNVSKLANVILTVTSSSNSAVANNTLNVKVENAVCAGQNGCLSANTNINFNILSPTITNASSCLNITAPDTVNAGASFNYSVTTKNVGSSTWHSSSPNKYGITAWPRSNYVFGDQVLVLPVATVATNSNATFTASATAPVNPPAKGCTLVSNNLYSCPFSFRMWQDWVEWFGPICSKNINVSVSPPTVSLTINNKSQENIDRGGSGTFSWTTSNANACVALGSQGNWTTTSSGIPIATNGSAPTGTLTQPGWWSYSISCSNNFGVTNDEVWIFVPDCNEPPSLVSSSVTPATVAPGGSYSIGCNYGTQTNSINPVPSSGSCSFMGWSGTGANFACTAPATPGNYPNLCTIGTNSLGQADIKSPNYYCKRDSGINNTVVQILKPTISLGSISPFNAISGGSTPAPQNLSISNTGNTTLNWTYSSVGTGSWCSISPTSGTIPAGGTASVAVSVSAPTTVGSFNNCIIRISDPNATNNPQNLTVIYNVSPTDPTGVSATLATCPSRAVTVAWQANSGATSYTVYRNTTNDATTAVVLQAGLTGLSYVDSPLVGTYYYFVSAQNGSLSSGRTASSNNPVGVTACAGNDVPVAVAKISTTNSNFQPSITVSQGVATPIYLSAADSSDPDGWTNTSYGMSGGGAKCEWNRDLNQGAPTFENPSINNPNTASACNISLGSLTFNDAPGTYTYQVLRLTDRAGGVSNVASVSVTVVSGPKPTISLDPSSFIFNAESQGATPASQQLRIRNTGNAVLNWTFSRTGVGTWCNLSVASGTLNPGATAYTQVSVNSPSNVGSFTDCGIRISGANATNSPQDASVTYNVTSPTLSLDLLAATDGAGNGSGTWAQSLTAFDPLTNADFRGVLSGSANTGTGVYTFYCNRSDAGVNVTAGYDSQTTTSSNAINLLNRCASVYSTPGVYTAKMIIEKQGTSAEDRLTVTVNNSKGSINVRYSLDGIDQASSATINYGITGPTNIATGNYTVSGSSVHSNVAPGSYTLTYNSGGPTNSFINPNNPITPTANQTVSANSSITYILNFLSKPGPVCPSGSCCPGGTNSSATCGGGGGGGGGYTGVACRTIRINWTDGSTNEDGFYVYANQTGNMPSTSAEKVAQRTAIVTTTSKAGTNQAYTHTYSASNTNPYYFWVSAFNNGGAGESTLMPMSNNPVAANDCTANIVSSDKDMITVAGVNPTATACNGTADGTYIGTTPIKFFGGNTITFAINVCNNNNSFYDAQDVVVTDYLTNLRKPNSGWNTKICTGAGGSGTCSNLTLTAESGTSPNQTLTFSIGNVLLGQVKSILVTAEIAPAPLGSTSRFNNRAIIDYLKEDGSRSNRQASTPWLPYFSATSTPSRIEIPGR